MILVHVMVLIAQAIQLGSLSAAAGALPRSWATLALDYGFFWAIALTTVPSPIAPRTGSGHYGRDESAVVAASIRSHTPRRQRAPRRRYRLILLEDVVGLIDVFKGEFHGDELLMDDERTNTAAPNLAGKLEFVRLGLRIVDPDQVIIRTQAKRAERRVDGMRLRLQRQRLP